MTAERRSASARRPCGRIISWNAVPSGATGEVVLTKTATLYNSCLISKRMNENVIKVELYNCNYVRYLTREFLAGS